jgi:hypothetical protein
VVDGDLASLDEAARQGSGREMARVLASNYFDTLLEDMAFRAKIEREPLGDEATR